MRKNLLGCVGVKVIMGSSTGNLIVDDDSILVNLFTIGPQLIFGIANKGRIIVGYNTDFTIVDMKVNRTIVNDWVQSKAGWTPYHDE